LNREERQQPSAVAVRPVKAASVKATKKGGWTPEEDALLRELYHTTSAKTITAKLNHSERAIYFRAGYLGLKKSDRSGAETKTLPPVRSRQVHSRENTVGFNSVEEKEGRREQAVKALQKAKAIDAGKKLKSVRIDKRTVVLTNNADKYKTI
jgi:hypothetical protein